VTVQHRQQRRPRAAAGAASWLMTHTVMSMSGSWLMLSAASSAFSTSSRIVVYRHLPGCTGTGTGRRAGRQGSWGGSGGGGGGGGGGRKHAGTAAWAAGSSGQRAASGGSRYQTLRWCGCLRRTRRGSSAAAHPPCPPWAPWFKAAGTAAAPPQLLPPHCLPPRGLTPPLLLALALLGAPQTHSEAIRTELINGSLFEFRRRPLWHATNCATVTSEISEAASVFLGTSTPGGTGWRDGRSGGCSVAPVRAATLV
jgi:hypothetical protein